MTARKFHLKHQMSCLPDQAIDVDINEETQEVTLALNVFDSALVSWLVVKILPAQYGVIAYRDDNDKIGDGWITKPAPYSLVLYLANVKYRLRVVKLFDQADIALTLSPYELRRLT